MRRLLAIVPLLLYGCAEQVSGGGGGIETGNALAVQFTDSVGVPAARTTVRIVPADYRAKAGDTTTPPSARRLETDSLGWIRTELPTGTFRIEAHRNADGAWWEWRAGRDEAKPAAVALARIGSVHGTALLPQGVVRAWIRIPGRAGGVWTEGDGSFVLDSLPPGNLTIEALFDTLAGEAQVQLAPGSQVNPDIAPKPDGMRRDTVFVDARSAGVQAPIEGFPLLLRLDSSWFPFATASPMGADLRVLQSDKVLPMEIERWDVKQGKAELWVRVDVPVRDSIPLVLVWGGTQASLSKGGTVFRPSEGFQSVWHMQNSLDASGSSQMLNLAGTLANGTIAGPARSFASDSAALVSVNWQGATSAFQWDAWVLPQSQGLSLDAILSAGPYGPRLHRSGDEAGACFTLADTSTGSIPATVCSQRPLNDGSAHLVTGQWSHDTLRLYVDGILQGIGAAAYSFSRTMPVFFGRHPNGLGVLTGMLDEVRFQETARSADWIRLSWATQRPLSSTVRSK
ncbi:MAG: hypothetical protein RL318_2526 [Fibrobacterota bacterium]|jgi:hypothetical protein